MPRRPRSPMITAIAAITQKTQYRIIDNGAGKTGDR